MTEVTSYAKNDLDSQLAAIEAIERSEVPTKLVRGKERPVNLANHKRKLRKQAINAHKQNLIEGYVASAVAVGHTEAAGRIERGRTVIYEDGLPIEGGI